MPCPHHPYYPTDKPSQKASARTLDHQVAQPVNRHQAHQAVVEAADYRMRMRCKRDWTSCAGTERSGEFWYSLSLPLYNVVTEMKDFDFNRSQQKQAFRAFENLATSISFPEMYMIFSC